MSQRITRSTLVIMLVALAGLGACSNPTAPARSVRPGVRSADVTPTPVCKDGGWVGSSGRC